MYQSNQCFNIPPPGNPREFELLENFCSNPQHIFIYYRYKSLFNTFEYGTQPWFINPREISVTRNMKSRLAIKFPTPYERWSNALPPGHEEASIAQGIPGRAGMFKLWFDWYINSCYSILINLDNVAV